MPFDIQFSNSRSNYSYPVQTVNSVAEAVLQLEDQVNSTGVIPNRLLFIELSVTVKIVWQYQIQIARESLHEPLTINKISEV